jgi:hypothetical protein
VCVCVCVCSRARAHVRTGVGACLCVLCSSVCLCCVRICWLVFCFFYLFIVPSDDSEEEDGCDYNGSAFQPLKSLVVH